MILLICLIAFGLCILAARWLLLIAKAEHDKKRKGIQPNRKVHTVDPKIPPPKTSDIRAYVRSLLYDTEN